MTTVCVDVTRSLHACMRWNTASLHACSTPVQSQHCAESVASPEQRRTRRAFWSLCTRLTCVSCTRERESGNPDWSQLRPCMAVQLTRWPTPDWSQLRPCMAVQLTRWPQLRPCMAVQLTRWPTMQNQNDANSAHLAFVDASAMQQVAHHAAGSRTATRALQTRTWQQQVACDAASVLWRAAQNCPSSVLRSRRSLPYFKGLE
jgi:hypothetical protein